MSTIGFQILFIALLGWICGILVNYLSDILPIKSRLATPICLHCQALQSPWNYFFWPRRCLHCGHRRSTRTWLVEFIYVTAAVWIWLSPPSNLGFGIGLIIFIYLGIVWIIDQEHRLILNTLIVVGLILGLISGTLRNGLLPTLIGGLSGLIFMLILFLFGYLFVWLMHRWRQTDLNETAMGFGDVLLGAVIGLMVGFPEIIQSLTLSIIAAGLFSLIYILVMLLTRRYRLGMVFPYAPFLIIGAIYFVYF
jgi:prepilin signal peptidase PulO-like enzyme (type II secretory pathway)